MPDIAEPPTEEKPKKKPTHPPDRAREVVETIVFVVVLVLLLKLFVTEAFVIPTGSMAETLYGYQKIIKCPKCGHEFPVNSHDEVEGRQGDGKRTPLYGFCCPNCRYMGNVTECDPVPQNRTGDRVLVLKPLYEVQKPRRGDVVVFKFPEKPQEKHTAQNYIKRAEGFGGETVAIHRGDLFVTRSLSYPENDPNYPRHDDPNEMWRPRYMYPHIVGSIPPQLNPIAADLFDKSRDAGFPPGQGFEIVRKGEEQLLADMRLVWNNDMQPKELAGKVPPRWYAPEADRAAWNGDDANQPKSFSHKGADLHWIRYRHLNASWKTTFDVRDPIPTSDFSSPEYRTPSYIDNFLGYNAGRDLTEVWDEQTKKWVTRAVSRDITGLDKRWVGDLILECDAQFEGDSQVTLELSKGINRFQAVFGNGTVTLERLGKGGTEFGRPSRSCNIGAGRHTLRFANVDCRLWVWVDGKLIDFGSEGDYLPIEPAPGDGADPEGWTKANDIDAPASIGAKGNATIRNIKLHRDIYYTRQGNDHTKADIYYVQPGHYMCLGDNSAQSSDSRRWGTVPERLMLGKAVFVFFPISLEWKWGWPPVRFNTGKNRVGFIK